MSKRGNEQSSQRPNSQLRVLFVELNGADTTIEEALRTVERMRRPAEILQQPIKRIASSPSAAGGQSPPVESTTSDPLEMAQDQASDADGNGEAEHAASAASARQKRGQGPKKDRNAGIELVGNLDFVPK